MSVDRELLNRSVEWYGDPETGGPFIIDGVAHAYIAWIRIARPDIGEAQECLQLINESGAAADIFVAPKNMQAFKWNGSCAILPFGTPFEPMLRWYLFVDDNHLPHVFVINNFGITWAWLRQQDQWRVCLPTTVHDLKSLGLDICRFDRHPAMPNSNRVDWNEPQATATTP